MALSDVQEMVGDYMDRIVKMFKPGVKITILVRTPDHPTRDFCMTDDNLDEVIAMVERRIAFMKIS